MTVEEETDKLSLMTYAVYEVCSNTLAYAELSGANL